MNTHWYTLVIKLSDGREISKEYKSGKIAFKELAYWEQTEWFNFQDSQRVVSGRLIRDDGYDAGFIR